MCNSHDDEQQRRPGTLGPLHFAHRSPPRRGAGPSLPSSCETVSRTFLLCLRARTGVCWDAGEHEQWDRAQAASEVGPHPELIERPRRRRFSAQYKLEILRQADACTRPGEIGELLRREGLYSSLLTEWRRARDSGALQALQRPRGRRKARLRPLIEKVFAAV